MDSAGSIAKPFCSCDIIPFWLITKIVLEWSNPPPESFFILTSNTLAISIVASSLALISNDNDKGEVRLCAYDWELATLGVPQHDLAELLCFVLPTDCSRESVLEYIQLHRERLSKAAGCSIDADAWQFGFRLALRDLIMNRFSMYFLMQPFRPQQFLPRIIRTWRRLHDMFDAGLYSC